MTGPRLESVTTRALSAALHTPFVTALRRTTTVDTIVVTVTDSDGMVGWGEAPQVWQVTGESLAGAQACLDTMLGPAVVGLPLEGAGDRDFDGRFDPLAVLQRVVARNFGAKAALDCAIRDLQARREGVSLAHWLARTTSSTGSASTGSASTGEVPSVRSAGAGVNLVVATDVTLAAGDLDDLAEAAAARVGEGFTTLKVKVGTDAATDIERVRAIRSAVGPDIAIRLDANQGWSPTDAVAVIRALTAADLGVEFVEQPVAGEDIEGLAWVRRRVDLPIMADESVYGLTDLRRAIRLDAADLVNVKLAKCGGLGVGATMLAEARDAGLGTIVGSMMETHVGVGAAASLVAAHPTSAVSDLDAAWWAQSAPVVGGPRYGPAGTIALAPSPGLGITALV